jgi:hypothetical protein
MNKLWQSLIVALALAGMLVAALPAQARPLGSVRTDDRGEGGRAVLDVYSKPFYRLKACDRDADGYGVRAYASFTYGDKDSNLVINTAGAGECTESDIRIRGRWRKQYPYVWLGVCLRDHNDDQTPGGTEHRTADRYCDWKRVAW